MKQIKQKQYQISCECGAYHWVRKRKPNQDMYMCAKCKTTFVTQEKERNLYVMRGNEVFKKRGEVDVN